MKKIDRFTRVGSHENIADVIAKKNNGEIFDIILPVGTRFTTEDFNQVLAAYAKRPERLLATNLSNALTSQDFVLVIGEGSLAVYKDTAENTVGFLVLEKEIETVLKKYPEAYATIMNALVNRLPAEARAEFGVLPTRPTPHIKITVELEVFSDSVIRAVRKLLPDPQAAIH